MNADIHELIEFVLTTETALPHWVRQVAFRILKTSYQNLRSLGGVTQVHERDYSILEGLIKTENKKIQAIKHLRTVSGLGLKEAKEALEREFDCAPKW